MWIHLYLIDCQDPNPLETFQILKNELRNFNENLMDKPYLICRTKSDLNIEDLDNWKHFDKEIMDISSIKKDGLSLLVNSIADLLK